MERETETSYRDRIDADVAIDVRFITRRRITTQVTEYTVVLLVLEPPGGGWRAVRVYDNAHGNHDMHRYSRDGVKQAAETSHHGSPGEAMRSAIEAVRGGYREMIDSWRR
jgi:hypothetical protein